MVYIQVKDGNGRLFVVLVVALLYRGLAVTEFKMHSGGPEKGSRFSENSPRPIILVHAGSSILTTAPSVFIHSLTIPNGL